MAKLNTYKLHIFGIIALLLLLALVILTPTTNAATVTQGYGSDDLLQRGMIVGLKEDNLRKVELINSDDYELLHGVVIGANDSAILLGNEDEKVYVASGGRFPVIVSSQNGSINVGDYVAISALDGIGMKSSPADPVIVGKAIEGFDASNKDHIISTAQVKDSNGDVSTLAIGLVTVDVSIGKNPNLQSNNYLPTFISNASEYIAGKPVSPARVYMSILILIMATALSGSLIYSAVRSSVISIGRNPLSRKSIMRGLLQVIIIGIIVFLSGVFGVYLLLKL